MDKRDEGLVYDELALRDKIVEKMVEKKVINFYDVFDSISHCREIGLEAFLKELDTL